MEFVPEVAAATGHPVHLGYEWHAYSYGFSSAVKGERAHSRYRARSESSFLVLSGWTAVSFGFRCVGSLPDFDCHRWDVIVTTPALNWSMVFTHEDGYGPYFQDTPRAGNR